MYPDDVVSALHFDQLGEDLVKYGWKVDGFPSNRSCRARNKSYKKYIKNNDINYIRIWRPDFNQKLIWGRLVNSLIMLLGWLRLILIGRFKNFDAIIIGTDPIFSNLISIPLKFFHPNLKIIHWCFDLHPDASVVSGQFKEKSIIVKSIKILMKKSYTRCDLIADIGKCMRSRLREYNIEENFFFQLTPWAINEINDLDKANNFERNKLFGDAKIGILYSGNLGEAHEIDLLLAFIRKLRCNNDIRFCFSIRGNLAQDLKNKVTKEDTNITFQSLVSIENLPIRLGAADIHITSLKDGWQGIAVPSKFFGSLSVGRPTLFIGPLDSAIANWNKKFNIGWNLTSDNLDQTVMIFSKEKFNEDVQEKRELCFKTYNSYFSRKAMTLKINKKLNSIL